MKALAKHLKLTQSKNVSRFQSQWFGWGTLVGGAMLSIAVASVPSKGTVTDDTVMYQNLSDIQAPRAGAPNFDSELRRLNSLEGRYREKLPSVKGDPRILSPMKRIAAKQYLPTVTPAKKKISTQQAGRVSR